MVKSKKLPFNQNQILKLSSQHPTPFYIYDETGIRNSAQALNNTFSWIPNFKNYFAIKALPNPEILKILKNEGMGADCSSLPELLIAQKAGLTGEDIMFTSNDTPSDEFQKARELEAIINLDDIGHISFLEKHAGIPSQISFRYNPRQTRKGNNFIGKPEESKYGLTKQQLFEAYKIMQAKGVSKFGLHTMVASNELDPNYFIQTAEILFQLVNELFDQGIKIDFINMGGGIGIPYKPTEHPIDLDIIKSGISNLYQQEIKNRGRSLNISMECGRFVTGPHGYLVSQVRHLKDTYRQYVGLDACMSNLMRPAIYGAYHHITVLGKEDQVCNHVYDVVGSLCENNDKFAIQRHLPEIKPDDFVVIHDAGAHGHAMGFQYNGKLRSAEFLMETKGNFKMIRRAETVNDYFSTLHSFSK